MTSYCERLLVGVITETLPSHKAATDANDSLQADLTAIVCRNRVWDKYVSSCESLLSHQRGFGTVARELVLCHQAME